MKKVKLIITISFAMIFASSCGDVQKQVKKDENLPVKTSAGTKTIIVDQKNPKASDDNPGTEEAPFLTINAGLAKVQPGDTVLVKAGLYRENVVIKTSGTESKRITLKSAKGERVIVSGGSELKNWKPCTKEEARGNPDFEKIYFADLDYRPAYVIQDDKPLKQSRWPKQAKARIVCTGGDDMRIKDEKNLTQPAGFWKAAPSARTASNQPTRILWKLFPTIPLKKNLQETKNSDLP